MNNNKIIVVDVESTCWENNQMRPTGEQSEIIEIGICILHIASGEIANGKSILVKPARSKVSPFCTQLTTITQDMVEGGISFAEACALIQDEYDAKNHLWGSWGDYDRKMFQSQCPGFGVEYPFSDNHVNLKKLFAAKYQLPKAVGMARALQVAGLDLIGTHHRGGDDAMNIARLAQGLAQKFGQNILNDSL